MDSPRTILKTLKTAKRILIPLHVRPDGDSIGCALASYHFLKGLGKKATVVSADSVPENFFFLASARRIKVIDPAALDLSRFDLLLLVDSPNLSRLTYAKELFLPPQLLTIVVDHHVTNQGFGNLNYVNPQAAATAEVLDDLFKLWKVKITPEIATALLVGIYTDTFSFLSPATTAGSFTKAGDLVRRGAEQKKIIEDVFRSWTPKTLRVLAIILANAKTRHGVSYSTLSLKDLRSLGVAISDLAEIRSFAASNLLLPLRGVGVAAMFTEEKPKLIRVNLRSKSEFDVAKTAQAMGGGGHRHAAAFEYQGPLKEAVTKTLQLLR